MTRLPNNYELPKSEGGNYTKLKKGTTTKIRILTSPIVGWEYFTNENKPKRQREAFNGIPSDSKEGRKPKEFWAFVVWNYEENAIQIMEITQNTIKEKLFNLAKDSDFGDPKAYDIKIARNNGEGIETKYDITALGKAEFSPEKANVEEIMKEAKGIRLEALYDGDDPFKPF